MQDRDPFDLDEPQAVGPSDVRNLLEAMVSAAGENGLPLEYLPTLVDLVLKFEDVFRIELGNNPPADVEALRITVQDIYQSHLTRHHRYGPTQSDFFPNPHAAATGDGVHSSQSAKSLGLYCGTCAEVWSPIYASTHEPINTVTVPIAGTAPYLAAVARNVRGGCGFANIDMTNVFTQLPLHSESQEVMISSRTIQA